MKKILVTGITGQDGSLMCDYLINLFTKEFGKTDFKIYGSVRRLSVKNHENIAHLEGNPYFEIIDLDLNDAHSIRDCIIDIDPDYFINFAAQSFVAGSWKYPIQTWGTDADAVLHILESIRRFAPKCRFYNAGSSEEFGDVVYSPQNDEHPLRPQSPYGAAKCAARHIVRVYKESYNLYAVQGWLFNHEGIRRGIDFVTRKITYNIAKFKIALEKSNLHSVEIPYFSLGNLDAQRDWSDAEDFMEGVWLMLNQTGDPRNYVLASGEMHTIREFLEESLKCANIDFYKTGESDSEKYYSKKGGHLIMSVDPKFYRPAEVYELCGDPTKAEEELNWKRKTDFKGLVNKMYQSDYTKLSSE
jgi:GDPmannose 4,6-dehydratase